ncbi:MULTISPECIES: acyl-CoA thioester hydrolase/BAAT C-terminal domain-containing protein [unclassified Pseudoalteromonas]|uniref:acyl-CoA thioester hydrolase/BAAT C-terminal domain-containing protein n=1 Tax=unclassified Pseudoalteromonas TaxID=194690 RepID=UPI00209688AA|nr:acyl-CoA thioester hydrolase/BAAT C-terminal domain-containing protein [Pseudoalteromonas sp. XMcav2-N]MCO7188381.1 dienelactone hydrolase [Pseudoalteromonas sp. XMcav2-N]
MMFRQIVKTTLVASLLLSSGVYGAVAHLSMEKDGLVGKFHSSDSTEQRIGVLVLGGSEGGLPEKLAQPIIEAGHPTLALAYFKSKGLPQELEKIPLEYFTKAKSWLQSQRKVFPDKLILVGWSKGAEAALLLATRDPQISKVVAIAPSSVVWAGILKDWQKVPASSWTEQGKALPHVPFKPSGPVNGLRDLYTQSLSNRADADLADIPVTAIRAQVTLMSGEKDTIWPAPQMAETICNKMNAKRAGQCEHLYYEGLDHLLNYQFIEKGTDMHQLFIKKLSGGF